MHIHAHTCTYIHIHTHTYTYIHIHTHTYTYIHIHTHTYIHTSIHPSIHTYIHICMYIYIYVCVCVFYQEQPLSNIREACVLQYSSVSGGMCFECVTVQTLGGQNLTVMTCRSFFDNIPIFGRIVAAWKGTFRLSIYQASKIDTHGPMIITV